MKKTIFILCFILILCYIAMPKTVNLTRLECIEDGICKNGLEIIIQNKPITVNKNTCQKYNGTWKTNLDACYFR